MSTIDFRSGPYIREGCPICNDDATGEMCVAHSHYDIKHFIRVNKITMTTTRVDRNPNMDSADMDHWKCVLTRKFETDTVYHDCKTGAASKRAYAVKMTTYFSMGYGHHGKAPDVATVLDCLASDSSSIDQSFESWYGDFGYDTDSRKAENTYKVCVHQAGRLRNFLWDDLYLTLLNGVERL